MLKNSHPTCLHFAAVAWPSTTSDNVTSAVVTRCIASSSPWRSHVTGIFGVFLENHQLPPQIQNNKFLEICYLLCVLKFWMAGMKCRKLGSELPFWPSRTIWCGSTPWQNMCQWYSYTLYSRISEQIQLQVLRKQINHHMHFDYNRINIRFFPFQGSFKFLWHSGNSDA